MRKTVNVFIIIALAIVVSSCLGTSKSTSASKRPMNADVVRLDLKMEDFQLLGEQTYNIVYRNYLGVFTVIDSINGQVYERRNQKTITVGSSILPSLNTNLNKAIAPIIEKYPDIDFVTPVYSTTQQNGMLLGSKNKLTVKVKAYKFK